MSRWKKGEAAIERLVADGELQQVTGAQADGQRWIAKARRTCASAAELIASDPDSAYILPTTPRASPAWPCSRTKASVELRADAESLAAELHDRYGDAVDLLVGGIPFPSGIPVTCAAFWPLPTTPTCTRPPLGGDPHTAESGRGLGML